MGDVGSKGDLLVLFGTPVEHPEGTRFNGAGGFWFELRLNRSKDGFNGVNRKGAPVKYATLSFGISRSKQRTRSGLVFSGSG